MFLYIQISVSKLLSFSEPKYPQGFTENKYFGIIVDGVNYATCVKGAFDIQLIEHGTVGHDDTWHLPRKYVADAPELHGEWFWTLGNWSMQSIWSQEQWTKIIKSRCLEIEWDPKRIQPIRLCNHIRKTQGLAPVEAPPIEYPKNYYLSQYTQKTQNISDEKKTEIVVDIESEDEEETYMDNVGNDQVEVVRNDVVLNGNGIADNISDADIDVDMEQDDVPGGIEDIE